MVQVFLTMSDWSDSQMKNVHWCKDSIDSCSHPRLFTLGHIPHRSQCLNQRCNEDLQRIWSFLDSPTPQEKVFSLPYIIHLVSIGSDNAPSAFLKQPSFSSWVWLKGLSIFDFCSYIAHKCNGLFLQSQTYFQFFTPQTLTLELTFFNNGFMPLFSQNEKTHEHW